MDRHEVRTNKRVLKKKKKKIMHNVVMEVIK